MSSQTEMAKLAAVCLVLYAVYSTFCGCREKLDPAIYDNLLSHDAKSNSEPLLKRENYIGTTSIGSEEKLTRLMREHMPREQVRQ